MRRLALTASHVLLAACSAAPCELPELASPSGITWYVPLELVIVVDGSAELAAHRPELEAPWQWVLEYALYQRGDGQAAYLHERARVRFVAAAPGCERPVCDGRSTAEWERYSPERDDAAFAAQASCLWQSVPPCAESRPIDALLEAVRAEPIHPRAELVTVIVSARDDASDVDPALAATQLVALGEAALFHSIGVAAGLGEPGCRADRLDAAAVPRLAAFVEALPPLAHDVHASVLCGANTDARALGGGTVTLDYIGRGSFALVMDEGGAVDCAVEEVLPLEGPVTRCGEVSHLARALLRVEADGREVCSIEQRPLRDGPGWYHLAEAIELRFVSGSEPMPDAEVTLRCPSSARACTADADCLPVMRYTRSYDGARCDRDFGVCVLACGADWDCWWPGDTCAAADAGEQRWCVPAPVCT